MDNKSYNLYISSNDRISGTVNNSNYFVQWDAFLPKGYKVFKVQFYALSVGGYNDSTSLFGGCQVFMKTGSKNFSYETSSKGQSNILGYIDRNSTGFISAGLNDNAPKFITMPTSNIFNLSFFNAWNNTPYTTTNGADMVQFEMVFVFTPVE
jgi:hypothetical protein